MEEEEIFNEDDNEELEDRETGEEDNIEDEYEEYEVPEYIPDELIPPDKFDDTDSELSFYKENYTKLIDIVESDSVKEMYRNKYKEELIDGDEDVNKLKAIRNLVESGNPEEYIKLYAPEYLVKNRVSAGYSNEEKFAMLDTKLKNEFGEDYREAYDRDKASIKGTLSNRMFERQNEILKAIDEHNKYIDEVQMNTKPPSEEDIERELVNHYENDFKESHSIEEYREFANYALDYARSNNISMLDMHKMLYFPDYVEDAYNQGLRDGKKGLVKEIGKMHNTTIRHQPVNKNIKEEDFSEFGTFGKKSMVDLIKYKG